MSIPSVPLYETFFGQELNKCVEELNKTGDPILRFNLLLRLQAAYDVVRFSPEGGVPHDQQRLAYISSCKHTISLFLFMEEQRNHFYCHQLRVIKDRLNSSRPN
jgi:hypothetical protein